MTEKRFLIRIDKKNGVGLFDGDLRLMYIQFSNIEDAKSCENALIHQCNLMNELYEENRELQRHIDVMRSGALTDDKRIKELYDENEQLRKECKELRDWIDDITTRYKEQRGIDLENDLD